MATWIANVSDMKYPTETVMMWCPHCGSSQIGMSIPSGPVVCLDCNSQSPTLDAWNKRTANPLNPKEC